MNQIVPVLKFHEPIPNFLNLRCQNQTGIIYPKLKLPLINSETASIT